jgi:hypothetical protein
MRALVSALCAAAVLAGSARAQTYTIKVKEHPGLGETVAATRAEKNTTRTKVKTSAGKVLSDKTEVEIREEAYTETVTRLKKGQDRPVAYKRSYAKARTTSGARAEVAPYQGRTVLFEERDGKYVVRGEGKPELTAKDLQVLAKEANDDKEAGGTTDLLPDKAVKVGQAWEIAGKALTRVGLPNVNAAKSKGQGKLLKAYRKDGKQFGVLEFRLRIVLNDEKGLKWAPAEIVVTVDTAIDGSAYVGTMTTVGKLAATRQVEAKGEKYTLEITIDGGETRTVRPKS